VYHFIRHCVSRLCPYILRDSDLTFTNSGLIAILGLVFGYVVFQPQEDVFWPDWDAPGGYGQQVARYPTDFTRDIIPLPCHSHNDYWRRIPFFNAVHAGCSSVEADVWAYGDKLYVGHSIPSLTSNRTFESLYIDPIMMVLNVMNPPTLQPYDGINGVFDEAAGQTLVLLVDFKTEGNATFIAVQKRLEPLRQKGYLTYFNGSAIVPGVVTVVGTGNTPFELIAANTTYREIFFDAPITAFSVENPSDDANKYTPFNSYYASGSLYLTVGFPWGGKYRESQLHKIRDHIAGVRKAGLKSRFWDTPAWPIGLRNSIWAMLVQEGQDVLNVDSLTSATKQTWGKWG
jgi:hypothetical protein